MEEKSLDVLALSLVPGLGSIRVSRLIQGFEGPTEVFSAPRSRLKSLGLSTEEQYYILGGWARADAAKVALRAEKEGVKILTSVDSEYPAQLRTIFDPPPVLYLKGDLGLLNGPGVAIVGSRKCSVYGAAVAFALARDLARFGLVIVSGLARGVDSKAHRGSLAAGGKTIAVLGTGIDVVYPRINKRLFSSIVESGCVLTEFPYGMFPAPQNFPIRNRLISGLSLGTVIPEAAEFSGSLITARMALEQNRELWAVPGNITSPGSYGPNHLIKQGAKPIVTAQDVLDELPIWALRHLSEPLENSRPELSADESRVLNQLSVESATPFETLLDVSGMSITSLSKILFSLEVRGLIQAYPGRRYARKLKSLESRQSDKKRNRSP